MEADLLQVPEELVKLYGDIYLTAYLLFVNSIPFFIALIKKICFTSVNNLSNKKLETIFNAFKEIYIYYTKRGFHIKTLHAYEEISPIQAMIY